MTGRQEFLTAFQAGGAVKEVYEEKEALETDMVRAYNTVGAVNRRKEKELAVWQKEKEYAGKHIQEISRKLDTVKIQESQEHLQRLEADTEKYAAELEERKETLKRNVRHWPSLKVLMIIPGICRFGENGKR